MTTVASTALLASASFQFAAGLAAWDEERQGSTERDLGHLATIDWLSRRLGEHR